MKKILNGIIPYNDLYYSYCLYNSLFSAVKFYGGDILPILINGVPDYYYDSNSSVLGIYYKDVEELNIILDNIGLIDVHLSKSIEFHEFIEKSIDNNSPVLINIDWYYILSKKQPHNNIHRMHTILVTGYDKDREIYNIFDQKYVDTLTYSSCEIPYKLLEQAYLGYLKLCETVYSDGAFNVQKKDKYENSYDDNKIKKIYINNILNKNNWQKRIFVLESYVNEINDVLSDENFLTSKFSLVLSGLNDIISHKTVEKFIYQSLFENEIMNIDVIEKTKSNWNIIRSKLLKSSFEGAIEHNDKMKIITLLNEIIKFEKSFCDKLGR